MLTFLVASADRNRRRTPAPGRITTPLTQELFTARRVAVTQDPCDLRENRDRGTMAIVSRFHAIATIGRVQASGFCGFESQAAAIAAVSAPPGEGFYKDAS